MIKFGSDIHQYLTEQNVNIDDLFVHPWAKTALAFVNLDEQGDRSFSFHREQTADVLMEKSQIKTSWFTNAAIFHLCSNTLTTQLGFELSIQAIELAKSQQIMISFDLNLRDELWPQNLIEQERIKRVIELADIIKFSEQELEFFCAGEQENYIQSILAVGVKLVVVTRGEKPVHFYGHGFAHSLAIADTKVIDTTGAGDSFVAGLLFAISQNQNAENILSDLELLTHYIAFAAECSAVTVQAHGASSSFPILAEVKKCNGLF